MLGARASGRHKDKRVLNFLCLFTTLLPYGYRHLKRFMMIQRQRIYGRILVARNRQGSLFRKGGLAIATPLLG